MLKGEEQKEPDDQMTNEIIALINDRGDKERTQHNKIMAALGEQSALIDALSVAMNTSTNELVSSLNETGALLDNILTDTGETKAIIGKIHDNLDKVNKLQDAVIAQSNSLVDASHTDVSAVLMTCTAAAAACLLALSLVHAWDHH